VLSGIKPYLTSKDSQNLSFSRQPQLMRMNCNSSRIIRSTRLWLMSKPFLPQLWAESNRPCVGSRSRWCNEDTLDSFSMPDRSDAFLAAVPSDVVETTKNLVGQI
jgi:hypothetical protein